MPVEDFPDPTNAELAEITRIRASGVDARDRTGGTH